MIGPIGLGNVCSGITNPQLVWWTGHAAFQGFTTGDPETLARVSRIVRSSSLALTHDGNQNQIRPYEFDCITSMEA